MEQMTLANWSRQIRTGNLKLYVFSFFTFTRGLSNLVADILHYLKLQGIKVRKVLEVFGKFCFLKKTSLLGKLRSTQRGSSH